MTYYESAEDKTITKQRAVQELKKHGVPDSEQRDFFDTVGDRDTYPAQDVLRWLGY